MEKPIEMNVVLVEPEIPPNTGNVARSCAATGAALHLVKPMAFSIDDKQVKRAGLDYWPYVKLEIHESLEAFLLKYEGRKMYFASTKGKKTYTQVSYPQGCFIVFGKETAGLPKELLSVHEEDTVRIPMGEDANLRSLNLSNSVSIVLFEALRQNGFAGLK